MENQAVKAPMVLIVERDPLRLTGMSAILDQKGYRCILARNVATGLKATQAMPYDLIVLSFERDALKAARNACEVIQPRGNFRLYSSQTRSKTPGLSH